MVTNAAPTLFAFIRTALVDVRKPRRVVESTRQNVW
jgi:hypothetical protein